MKKLLTTFFLCCCLVSLFACSCMHVPFGVEKIIDSELFFKGTVTQQESISIEEGEDVPLLENRGFGIYRYTLEVSEYIKGSNKSTVFVYSNMNSAACGVNYTVGSEMYIFTNKNEGRNYTSSCSGNFLAEYGNEGTTKTIIDNYKQSTTSQKWKNEMNVIEAEGTIINRTPQGVWKFYREDGSLASTGKFKNGKRKGKWKTYHQDGSLGNIGKYKKGKKKGKWKYYLNKKQTQEFFAKKSSEVNNKKGKNLHFISTYKNGKVKDTKYIIEQ